MSDKSNIVKKTLAPGMWVDQNDVLHVDVPAMLRYLRLPLTEANQSMAVSVAREIFAKLYPQTPIVERSDSAPFGVGTSNN